MNLRLYQKLVNRNYAVKRRYEGFVLSHPTLHRRCRAVSWGYLALLCLRFNVLHLPDRERLRAGNESGTGMRHTPEETAALLCRSETVSFDVFDTLLHRPFSEPTALFYVVGERLDIPDFRNLRTRAEQTARQRQIAACGNGEITLGQIYDVLAEETGLDPERGAACEAEAELALCLPDPYMQRVWKLVQAAGRQIVVTTDMYLPSVTIAAMLEKCGYTGYARLFVSGEEGCGKYDGALFARVKAQCPSGSYAHIGDSRGSDVARAKEAGFAAVHFPNIHELGAPYRPGHMSWMVGSAYRGLVNRRLYAMAPCDPAYEYGYKCGGILVLGFCRFLHEKAMQTGAGRILFFSRDGYILKEHYDRLYPGEHTEYVHWSRACAAKLCAGLYPHDYFRRFLDQKTDRGLTVTQILEDMDLEGMELPVAGNTVLTNRNLPQIRSLLRERLPEILGRYAGMYAQADRFLGRAVGDARRVLTVDCGWAGSGSIFLDAYLKRHMGLDVEVTGVLCGSNALRQSDSDFSETYFRTGRLVSYCFSAEHDRQAYETHYPGAKHNVYFEMLFGAPEPSFRGYAETGLSFDTESENREVIGRIHAGERAFCADWLEAFASLPYMQHISGSDAYAPFMAAVGAGRDYPACVFRDCVFTETTGGKKERI